LLKATKGELNTNSNVGLQLFWKRKYKSTLLDEKFASDENRTQDLLERDATGPG